METKDINGMRVLDQQQVDEIIAWCENDEYLTGGQVKDVEKRLSDGKDGYKDVSYKRWHFEREGIHFGIYVYWYIDIQQVLLNEYIATIEVGVKNEENRLCPAIVRMYESIRGANDLLRLIGISSEAIRTGVSIIHRQRFCND